MLDPKSHPTRDGVGWIAMSITCMPGILALAIASQAGAVTFAPLGVAWIFGVGGAWLFTSVALPWSNPPFLAAALVFGSSFANLVSAYWRRCVPEQSGETLRFHLVLGFAAGLAITALFFSIVPFGIGRLAALLEGAIGGTVFALLRFWMLR